MRYLRAKQIAEMLSVNLSTVWRWRKTRDFPQPLSLSSSTVVWSEDSIQKWIAEQAKMEKSA